MVSPRELQQLISMIEQHYEDAHHPSFSYTVMDLTNGKEVSNHQLYKIAKREVGPPTGMISRVVSKRVYEASLNEDSVSGLILSIGDQYNTRPETVSDDQLVRGL